MASTTTPMAVAGVGMISSVGLSAPEVAASVRAGTMRLTETSIMDKRFQPVTLGEVPEEGLPPLHEKLEGVGLTSREARLIRLAEVALKECLTSLPAGAAPPPLVIALPESQTTRTLDEKRFVGALAVQAGGFDRKHTEAFFRGRSGGLRAIARAGDWLDAGASFVIAGGVDTYRDLYVLGTLDMQGRLKSESNLDGFIPGEGAAFLLLARPGNEGTRKPSLAMLSGFAAALEEGH